MALNRDQYLQQYTNYAQQANKPAYDTQTNQLKQAYERNMLGFNQGANRFGELRSQTATDYASGRNRINEQQAAQMPQYQTQRNQTSVEAASNAQRLRELMAQRGLFRSGTAVGRELGIYNQAAQNRNDITTQENLARTGFGNRLSELGMSEANAFSGIGNRLAELEQQKALYGTQYGENEQDLARQYADRVALETARAPQAYENYALNVAGLTGQYGGQQTLTAQQLEQQRNVAALDESYRQKQLQAQQNQFNQNYALQQSLQNANISNMQFNQNLAGYQAGANTLLDVAGVTGQYNNPQGFYPGDLAKQYLTLLQQGR